MPTYKLTNLFQATTSKNRVGGWSETVYTSGASLAAALAGAALYSVRRCPLLPTTARSIGARVSEVGNPGSSLSDVFDMPGTANTLTDVPQMALQLRVRAANGAIRNMVLRCLPDARVESGEYLPSDAFTAALNTFFTQLLTYQLRTRDRTVPIVNLQGVTAGGLVTTAADFNAAVGDRVEFWRTRDIYNRPVRGTYVVTGTPAPTARVFQLNNWGDAAILKGNVRKVQFTFSNIQNANYVRVMVRKVGRPFVGYRGRRSKTR